MGRKSIEQARIGELVSHAIKVPSISPSTSKKAIKRYEVTVIQEEEVPEVCCTTY